MIRNPKTLFLKSLIQSQSHALFQRFPVSGTPKGKGKDKSGKPINRSTLTRKKFSGSRRGGVSGDGSGEGEFRGRKVDIDRLNRMAESCLNAPTPKRHLSAKDRLREAEREKLGLISKERQHELDQAKKNPTEEPFLMGTPGLEYISLGLVDAEKIPKYELTVEDGRKLAKEQSRVLMRQHRARQAAETTLLRLKKEAIAALPEKLKAAALVPDFTPFPANRFMATLTPPIEGYIDKVKEATMKVIRKVKVR